MRFNRNIFGRGVVVGGLLLSVAGCGAGTATVENGAAFVGGGVVVAFPIEREGENGAERSYDTVAMGRIAEGDVVEGRLRVANRSDKPLVIVQVITGCGCTTADYDPAPIPAGDTVGMTWRFDSRGRYGQQFKSIEIIAATGDGRRQCATVYLMGEVVL